jgi:DNA repair exonuclease SbcCD ATPase subunit
MEDHELDIELLKTKIQMLKGRLTKMKNNTNKTRKEIRKEKAIEANIEHFTNEINKINEKKINEGNIFLKKSSMKNKTQRVNINDRHNKIKLISPSEERFEKKIRKLKKNILTLEKDIELNEIMIMNSKQKHNKTEEEIDKENNIKQEITMFKDEWKEESKKLKDLIDELKEKQHKKEIHETMSDMLIKSLGTLSIPNIHDNNSNPLPKTLKSILKKKGGRKSNKTRKNKTRGKK